MARRRSRPMLVAPLIPLWALAAFYGVEHFAGTRFVSAFVVIMLLLLATLFTYVATQALRARRVRKAQLGR